MAELTPKMDVRDCSNCVNAQAAVAIKMAENPSRIEPARVTPHGVYSEIGKICGQAQDELADLYPEVNVACALGAWGVIEGILHA